MMTKKFKINGIMCTGCVQIVQDIIFMLPGVLTADVSLEHNEISITSDRDISAKEIQDAVKAGGNLYEISEC
ncbi:MAG: heavy metal-associated domain-containing protein [Flavobacteriaceae bacterium]|nr:heavy metal-associated domain-containing protein [Flavobacteriaceae bacterium]